MLDFTKTFIIRFTKVNNNDLHILYLILVNQLTKLFLNISNVFV